MNFFVQSVIIQIEAFKLFLKHELQLKPDINWTVNKLVISKKRLNSSSSTLTCS